MTTILVVSRRKNGKNIILTCLMFLIFILLNLNNRCLAASFADIQEKIRTKAICQINYNFSKTAAVVNPDCGSAVYINFKKKQVKTIVTGWPNAYPMWKSDTVVHIKGSCGTGCSQSIIFVAPATSIVCPSHEFRFESLNWNEPPDFYNNNPLLIEPHKEIYICYAEENVIQVFKMSGKLQATIHPPKEYYADEASIRHNYLVITYRNMQDHIKKIRYSKIKF